MTAQDIKSIEEIKGTAGFRLIEFLVQQKIAELESVMTIDSTVDPGRMVVARQDAIKMLTEFLKELQLTPVSERETRKTFE